MRRPASSSNVQPPRPDDAIAPGLPELMTVAHFLDSFRIGRTSFYREVNAGRLRIVKFGNATRIRRSDAETWLAGLPAGGPVGKEAPQ